MSSISISTLLPAVDFLAERGLAILLTMTLGFKVREMGDAVTLGLLIIWF